MLQRPCSWGVSDNIGDDITHTVFYAYVLHNHSLTIFGAQLECDGDVQ